ncbi:hypothetical protein WICMUC_003509 [Wickerhamomyces mucosus]|uniref:Ribosomal RNA-processing protein 43 n=1 Tax=Wickerhamomyces mucosus TaxID=1378264 RepID=A0A9P8PJZ8_9ASCO|nr:hypothetical protein WICMUC_003509 [Wickerhamomyces mucosus]
MSEQPELKLVDFPPAVLARISPELSLQRHLAIGLRPNLRTFEEFKTVQINDGGLSRYSSTNSNNESDVLGSSILRSGNTTVICTIRGGIIEEDILGENNNEDADAVNAIFAKDKESIINQENLIDSAPIYPIVEIERGRNGPPTDEEMNLSQKLYETFLHSKILSKSSLKVKVGLKSKNDKNEIEILYNDENSEFQLGPKRSWNYILYCKFKIFSRSGPLFDLIWISLISALKQTKLPYAYIDENAADIKIPIKMTGNFGTIREQYAITCDDEKFNNLILNNEEIGYSSNFGVISLDKNVSNNNEEDEKKMEIDINDENNDSILLVDLEGEEEEISCKNLINVVVDSKGENLKSLTLTGNIDKSSLQKAIDLSKKRSKFLINQEI